jgi:hypothetical protein
MVGALGDIEPWHSDHDTGLVDDLNPGASGEELKATFSSLGVQPTEELTFLWSWHDGETSEHPLIWYHDFLSAQEAAEEYRSLNRHPLIRWDRRFLPVFSFQGEWYAVYCAAQPIEAGPVVHFILEDEPRIAFANLTTMITTMAEVFRSGAVVWDSENQAMSDDVVAIAKIHAQRNPGYSFPYFVDDSLTLPGP